MAFGAKRIFPIDFKPGTAVGVALPFNGPAVFKSTYTTKDAIRNNLINFFLTNQPERYLNPTFGASLRSFIFQQISEGNIQSLKEDIQYQLNTYFPNVIVASLNIDSLPDINQINVELKYNVADTGISDNINITFE
jgi:phage baseplate assembly protein W